MALRPVRCAPIAPSHPLSRLTPSPLPLSPPIAPPVISAYYLDETLFHSAAIGGDLEVLKYLRAKGCPWDSRCCVHAAMHGNLEALKWLR